MLWPVRRPMHGQVTLYSNGNMVYQADKGFVGIDSLWYEICDNGYLPKCDTGTVIIKVFKDTDCDNIRDLGGTEFFIPEGFSPNGDGIHDFFEILGMEEYPDAEIFIFTRWGSQIFHKKNYGNLQVWGTQKDAWWDGYSYNSLTLGKNTKVPPGNYLYILHLGNGVTYKGTVMVSY